MDRLFTYGTLRPSLYPNRMRDVKSVRATITGFQMFNLGRFPALIKNDDPTLPPITGELIELPSVTIYDAYEGYPYLYNREQVMAQVGDDTFETWVYFMEPKKFDQQCRGAVSVVSGDWADVWKDMHK